MGRRERGNLERQVLHVLWQDSPLSAGQVRERFDETGRPALTTVLTVLDRLEKKDLVERSGTPRAQRFSPTRSESEATAGAMIGLLTGSSDRSTALLSFAGALDDDDLAVLRRAIGRGSRR